VGAQAQSGGYAQTFYSPLLQATAGGEIGIALSNPALSAVQVVATARDYTGALMTGVNNPVVLTLPAAGQVALTAKEIFGQGLAGRDGWLQIQSPSLAVSGFFLLFNPDLTYIDGAELSNAPQSRLVFPKVYSRFGSASTISFANTTNQSFGALLALYDNSGVLLGSQLIQMTPYSGFSGPVTNFVPGVQFSGYATLEALITFPRPFVGAVNYTNRADNALLPAVPITGGLTTGFIPHLSVGGNFSSLLGMLNLDSSQQIVQITAQLTDLGGNTSTRTAVRILGAKARLEEDLVFMFSLPFGVQYTGAIRFDVVGATPGVVSYVEFGTPDGILLSAVPAQGIPYSDFYFSHVAEGQGYYTGLALLNPNSETVPVSIDVYSKDGVRVASKVIDLGGGERRSRLISELMPGTSQLGGYVRVSATRDIYVVELFGSANSTRFVANVSSRGTSVTPLLSGNNVVGTSGALVVSSDFKVSLLIPPAAFSGEVGVQLSALDTSSFPKPFSGKSLVSAVQLLPAGLQFDKPLRLTFPTGLQLPPGTQLPLYAQSPLTNFQYQLSEFVAIVDDTGRNAVATVTRSANFGVVWPDSDLISITSVDPPRAASGQLVTITGSGFGFQGFPNTVTFAGPDNTSISGFVLSATSTSLQVLVPAGIVTGKVFVSAGGRSSQGFQFTANNPNPIPAITSTSPAGISTATSFATILVTGTGFNANTVGTLDGGAVPTLYLGPTTLRLELTGPLMPGLHAINIANPPPGGGTSDMLLFQVF